MEERKLKEVEYYDSQAAGAGDANKESGSLADVDPFVLNSYTFLRDFFKNNYQHKKVLDFGSGTGMHLAWLSAVSAEVVGIDLSLKSVMQARKKVEKGHLDNVTLVCGDCEATGFADQSFDVVFDGGTFSSLDLGKSLKEIHRILKPGGILIGIETLGHNPLTNLKRRLNKMAGKRTDWAVSHIFSTQSLELAKQSFSLVQVRYFHVISWLAFPFLKLPGGIFFLKAMEFLDTALYAMPFFKKYSFKVVFVFKKLKTPEKTF